MKTSSLQFKVLLLVASAMMVSLAVSVASLTRVYGSIQELDRISRDDFQSQAALLQALVNFKVQVQEWKDVLLRGHDPAALDKYWNQFLKEEKETQSTIREARAGMRDPAILAKLEEFVTAHRVMGERYRAGLEAFKQANFDAKVGDAAVKGIDRAPTQILEDAQRLAVEAGAKATAHAVDTAETGYRIAILGTIAVMLAALVLLWLLLTVALVMSALASLRIVFGAEAPAPLMATPVMLAAAIETLAIVAYHQPVTRAEIEEIRGVVTATGTLDVLLKTGWIRPRVRRKAPGRPITYGTTEAFLSHFGLEEVGDLPGLDELKGAGLLEGNLPPGFGVPLPTDDSTLRDDEEPLDPGDLDLGLAPPASRSEK